MISNDSTTDILDSSDSFQCASLGFRNCEQVISNDSTTDILCSCITVLRRRHVEKVSSSPGSLHGFTKNTGGGAVRKKVTVENAKSGSTTGSKNANENNNVTAGNGGELCRHTRCL